MIKFLTILFLALCAIASSNPVPPEVDIDQQLLSEQPRTKENFFLPPLPLPELPKPKINPEVIENLPLPEVVKAIVSELLKQLQFVDEAEVARNPGAPIQF
ncbi:hypothetical protein HHI36_020463 [Cryptolaemus montrouzieri]|uniref:Uncharacterized protein n=1 Tax=Cryptolaemus montrouzieri TaxID=559131 RepID=A0ABD2NB08_9CUCU